MQQMVNGIFFGKAFGIPLRLHYSWFIVFALVTWALTVGYFPQVYPHWSTATAIVAGLLTSLLFFGSVLAHELAHSLVAQAAGIRIHSITLFIFGGVSQMAEEPGRPQVEFRMALAGPATSLVIGGTFLALYFFLKDIPEFVRAMSFWLGWINLVLAGFNLIPGFPLDGGRVLRSLLWWHSGRLLSATRTASNIGRGVGYLFIFIGIGLIFYGSWLNGLWLAFIGWFLENAAATSYRQLALMDMLKGHTASELMTREWPAVPPHLTVQQLVHEQIFTSGRRSFPVVDADKIVGLVTIHDVKSVPKEQWTYKTVSDIMTPASKLKSVEPNDDLGKVFRILTEHNVNQVPVIKNGNLLGMIARDSLLTFISIRS